MWDKRRLRAAIVKACVAGLPGPRRAGRGFTLVELVVVVCIVAVSAALLVDRLRFYQEAAEKAAMEYTVGAVRSGLQLRVAAMLIRGEERNIESLARANPVDWLVGPPPGYRGEFRALQPAVPRGSWYFDATRSELVYVPDLDGHLKVLADGSKRLRFRVRFEIARAEPDSERKRLAFTGMRVEPATPYTWF
ncbi:MAG: prepilin-type N-terminal cleavage/methylation domain-containing protein [Betaproteobacteria bacterium]|nr:MAG: prepilin-type N-terminal cleavage/methylation domain-containing protein [Betaproteobacteria bacterium]TMG76405.1 MAG: prepilin-type N-terminal cleavage/methylation domain-containing protein [Betaproteobacteria bacterium]